MKFCRNREHRITPMCIFYFLLGSTILLGVCDLMLIAKNNLQPGDFFAVLCIIQIFPVLFMLLTFGFVTIWENRKFSVTEYGIDVCYSKAHITRHSWKSVTEVALCTIHYGRFGPDTVIRVVIGQEPSGPSKGYGKWIHRSYSHINHAKVIIIDYREEYLNEIQSVYPAQVLDYRNILTH